MKVFHCDHCRQLVFFENYQCVSCGHALAFLPDLGVVASLDPAGGNLWTSVLPRSKGRKYRLCQNYVPENICNWAEPADNPDPLCRSCRLTRVIPDLNKTGNRAAWFKLEVAKRRLVYTLLSLGLPIRNKQDDPERGLAFEFRADPENKNEPRVLTGHADGVITLNIAEANDSERERVRNWFNEAYRTLLGHFRHESGHFFWDRLVRDGKRIAAFRERFGDERADYAEALKRHHASGPPANWQDRFVTAYAASHPWEDWAETWAHFLHMTDTLETAAACGVRLRPPKPGQPTVKKIPDPVTDEPETFDEQMAGWLPLTYVLNNLNRGLGLPDAYPFVLSLSAVEKLRFVNEMVWEARREPAKPASPAK